MNGKTAKLLRRVAETNPYGVKEKDFDAESTLYGKHKNGTGTMVIAPGKRLTYKFLKKFYKQGKFTTADLRNELQSAYLRKVREEMAARQIPSKVAG